MMDLLVKREAEPAYLQENGCCCTRSHLSNLFHCFRCVHREDRVFVLWLEVGVSSFGDGDAQGCEMNTEEIYGDLLVSSKASAFCVLGQGHDTNQCRIVSSV